MLLELNFLYAQQNKATQKTSNKIAQFSIYCLTHPDATVKYKASGITLYIYIDWSYHSNPKGQSRVAG